MASKITDAGHQFIKEMSWSAQDEAGNVYDARTHTWKIAHSGKTIIDEAYRLKYTNGRKKMDLIGLDFETYGSVDLTVHGLDRYVSDPHFTPLIACVWDEQEKYCFDFTVDYEYAREALERKLKGRTIAAHNAGFEMAVLNQLEIDYSLHMVIDSAVVARAAGAGSKLEVAAPQLLGVDKLESGWPLIKLFSMPGKYQEAAASMAFDPAIVNDNVGDWQEFVRYCYVDAQLSFQIVQQYGHMLHDQERQFQQLTMRMNDVGWPVDVEMVREMNRRFLENLGHIESSFRRNHDAADLNFNSLKQMKEWCAERGVRARSFNEQSVARMIKQLEKKLAEPRVAITIKKRGDYEAVLDLLRTKQELGGSSLKKLQVILDTVSSDGRLRDQYLHCGAGQTLRTTGRSVQMQNLKRMAAEPLDMSKLMDDYFEADNTMMAANMRQVFTSSDPNGSLIVGDFSSVEARCTAWVAGEDWKTVAFRNNQDLYKVTATKIYGVAYDDVTKLQRQTGKVSELGCGYGIGAEALMSFAEGIGVTLTEGEAAKLVSDWRNANPKIVQFWYQLDDMLHDAVNGEAKTYLPLPDGFRFELRPIQTPASLLNQQPNVQSIEMAVYDSTGTAWLRRVFHGCHRRGRNIGYFKPTDRKTGDLWTNTYKNPKTKRLEFHTLWGGKLTGILVQSFCRELFFRCLRQVSNYCTKVDVDLIGQFHDEIVLDWTPKSKRTRNTVIAELTKLMSDPGIVTSFPLAAEVKFDYRYVK